MKYTFESEGVRYSKYTERGRAVLALEREEKAEAFNGTLALWSILSVLVLPAALQALIA